MGKFKLWQLMRFTSIILFLFSISFIADILYLAKIPVVYHGVYAAGADLSYLSLDAAQQTIRKQMSIYKQHPLITLSFEDKNWMIHFSDIDAELNENELLNQAYNIGRQGSLLQRIQTWLLLLNRGMVVQHNLKYDEQKLDNLLHLIQQHVNRDPENATIVRQDGQLQIHPEVEGQKIDLQVLKSTLTTALQQELGKNITIPINRVHPIITANMLSGMQELASYTTTFDPSQVNRTQNLILAVKQLNNTLVKSHEQFSFNKTIGPRLIETGYKLAPVFVENQLILDTGGGVCQVSSTLYNAALLANLEIYERSPHFQPPGYVPLGLDATVSYNLIDFKFKNPFEQPILITAQLSEPFMTVTIYGFKTVLNYQVKIETSDKQILPPATIVIQDSKLSPGIEALENSGIEGYRITVSRILTDNGKEMQRELISQDEFKPINRVIRVGIPQHTK